MPFTWTDPTVIMFAVYLAAMLGIGALGYLGTKNLSDYTWAGAAWAAWSRRCRRALPT